MIVFEGRRKRTTRKTEIENTRKIGNKVETEDDRKKSTSKISLGGKTWKAFFH